MASWLISKSSESWGEHGFNKSPIQDPRQKLAVTQSRGVRRENYPETRRAARSRASDSVNGEHCGGHQNQIQQVLF